MDLSGSLESMKVTDISANYDPLANLLIYQADPSGSLISVKSWNLDFDSTFFRDSSYGYGYINNIVEEALLWKDLYDTFSSYQMKTGENDRLNNKTH